ncbi:MAG TPA: cell division protein FtsQ/DivIB [Steroidobacteraceae bacterium]|nr:cell division protein FtsQ/DivIB [Steroidobacteraceae bacterium]
MLGRRTNRRRSASQERSGADRLRGSRILRSLAARLNWRRLLSSAVSLAGIAAAVLLVGAALDRPIESIVVTGRFQRVSPLDVERAVKASLNGAGLIGVRLPEVSAAVERLPWVDAVTVERSWPRGLTVHVIEQIAAARWGEGGLINTRGALFTGDARHIPLELPTLTGPDGTEPAVAQRYLAMQGRLAEVGMRVTGLRLDARGAWEFDLDNGVTVRLGRQQVDQRFETFMAVASKIVAQRASDIAYVDMRYANGFAIGWRGGAQPRPGGSNYLAANAGSRRAIPRDAGPAAGARGGHSPQEGGRRP